MVEPPAILHPYIIEYVLPLVLVFVLIFAILEKTQLLGKDKRQVNAIVSLVIGIILIASPAKYIIIELMPFLAVVLVIFFVFMLIMGFVGAKKDGDVLNKGLKITLGIIAGIALATFLLYITGYWQLVYSYTFGGGSRFLFNAILVVVIIGAVAAVLWGARKSGGSPSSS